MRSPALVGAFPNAPPSLRGGTAPNTHDDRDLLDAVRDGDMVAYGVLYERHIGAVRRLAVRMARDHHEADDICSEVFTCTLRAIGRGAGPTDDALPYLLRSVRHTAAKIRTRKDSGRADPLPADRLDRAEMPDWLYPGDAQAALSQLPDRHQHVLWATCVEGRSATDVAEQHGVEPGCITSLTLRARRALGRAYLIQRTQRPEPSPQCRRTRCLMPGCLRDEACESTVGAVERHVEACSVCADVYSEMRLLDRDLQSIGWPALVGAALRHLWAVGGVAAPAAIFKPLAAIVLAGGAVAGAAAVGSGAGIADDRSDRVVATVPGPPVEAVLVPDVLAAPPVEARGTLATTRRATHATIPMAEPYLDPDDDDTLDPMQPDAPDPAPTPAVPVVPVAPPEPGPDAITDPPDGTRTGPVADSPANEIDLPVDATPDAAVTTVEVVSGTVIDVVDALDDTVSTATSTVDDLAGALLGDGLASVVDESTDAIEGVVASTTDVVETVVASANDVVETVGGSTTSVIDTATDLVAPVGGTTTTPATADATDDDQPDDAGGGASILAPVIDTALGGGNGLLGGG